MECINIYFAAIKCALPINYGGESSMLLSLIVNDFPDDSAFENLEEKGDRICGFHGQYREVVEMTWLVDNIMLY